MRLSNLKIIILATVIAITLAGLAVIQFVLLRKTLSAEEQAFQRNAVVALSKAADAAAAGEILRVLIAGSMDFDPDDPIAVARMDSIIANLRTGVSPGRADFTWVHTDSISSGLFIDTVATDDSTGQNLIRVQVCTETERDLHPEIETRSQIVEIVTDSSHEVIRKSESDSMVGFASGYSYSYDIIDIPDGADSNRTVLITAALNRLEQQESVPVTSRIDSLELDSTIAEALTSEGIDLEYAFGVVDRTSGQLEIAGRCSDSAQLAASPYRTRLFPHDILSAPKDLVVRFPSKQRYIYNQLLPVALPTGLFLLAMAAAFVYSFRMIFSQRRMGVRLTEFINNMTHEFKTPIATIRLASEALDRPDVMSEPEKVSRFNRMISDENRRMQLQVDKILQLAVIEDGAIELKCDPVDLHATIAAATDAIQLTVTSRQGSLQSLLEATRSTVLGDEVHLYNIVTNLLDNACKYSPAEPTIRVSTELDTGHIVLRVADRGIGLAEEDHRRVFERYYRVATGDRHDVKGFGLGLSYVKLVVQSLGGSIAITGGLGKGTEVTLRLPLAPTEEVA